MKKTRYTQMLLLLLFFRIAAWAQPLSAAQWHLEKAGKGIQVFTAPGASGLEQIKVTALLTGTLDEVRAVFRDIDRQKDWVYSTRRAYLVQKTDDNHLLYYNETALPWPVSNRDIAIRMKLEENKPDHTLTITQTGEPTAVPEQKGMVRVPHLAGSWRFHQSGENQLQVEYYLDIAPGGSLPAWVANLFVAKGPYETLINLQKLLHG